MKILGVLAASVLVAASATAARANLVIDFRFQASTPGVSGDLHTINLVAGQANTDITVDVYAQVLPTGGITSTSGITNFVFRSTSAAVSGTKTITGLSAAFSPDTAVWAGGSTTGFVQDRNADGILDIGQLSGNSLAGNTAAAADPKVRAASNVPTTGAPFVAITGGAEAKVGTMLVHISALSASGQSTISAVIPSANAGTPAATWMENGSSKSDTVATSLTYLAGSTPLTFTFTASNPLVNEFVVNGSPANSEPNDTTLTFVGPAGSLLQSLTGNDQTFNKIVVNESPATHKYMLMEITGLQDVQSLLPANQTAILTQYNGFYGNVFNYAIDLGSGTTANIAYDFKESGTGKLVAFAIVPEPASLGLLALGALGLLGKRRTK